MELFGTAGIRGPTATRVTPDLALRVGRAAGVDGETFVVGRDGRVTGPALAAAMEAGLESAGADVVRVGTVPTPAIAYASQGRRGVMLTASHNPPADNGIKLFADGEEYDREQEQTVEERVDVENEPAPWHDWGSPREQDIVAEYRGAVISYARDHGEPLDGLRVAVDCGNGMGCLATPQVLRALGAHVVTLNANVDGHFPGRPSKPTPETVRDLRTFVPDGDFQLGIAHDGDADRIVILDGAGDVIHEDTIVAILGEHYTATSTVEDPVVVTTPNASARIDDRVRAAGGRVERVRLGALHEGIARVRANGGTVVFAAEPWKHIHTQFGGWIDGVTSAAILSSLVAASGDLDDLRAAVQERPYRKVSIPCPDDVKQSVMERLETSLPAEFPEATVNTQYGVRLELSDGAWTLVRPSGTEPYVRIYVESDDVETLVERVETVVESDVSRST